MPTPNPIKQRGQRLTEAAIRGGRRSPRRDNDIGAHPELKLARWAARENAFTEL
ncbi:hypothetical protein [Micromonospora avicenniae]|uniref:hypothetical protein n=1 Tax=Micromonospora avicenniae TaxID=1198245 RepID=UPI00332C0B90